MSSLPMTVQLLLRRWKCSTRLPASLSNFQSLRTMKSVMEPQVSSSLLEHSSIKLKSFSTRASTLLRLLMDLNVLATLPQRESMLSRKKLTFKRITTSSSVSAPQLLSAPRLLASAKITWQTSP